MIMIKISKSLVLQPTSDILEEETKPCDSGQSRDGELLPAHRWWAAKSISLSVISLFNKTFVKHSLNYINARSVQYSGK
jgi:hypothetical protein